MYSFDLRSTEKFGVMDLKGISLPSVIYLVLAQPVVLLNPQEALEVAQCDGSAVKAVQRVLVEYVVNVLQIQFTP